MNNTPFFPANSELYTKASENLNKEVEKELNKKDPPTELAKAALDNNTSGCFHSSK